MKKTEHTFDPACHSQLTSPLQPASKNGWLIAIRLTPHAFSDEFKGIFEDSQGRLYLKATVRAVPEDGLANKALLKVMSKRWGVARSTLTLQSGATSRLKIIHLAQITPALEHFIETELRAYYLLKNA